MKRYFQNIYLENIGKLLDSTGTGKSFLQRALRVQELTPRTEKCNHMKLKSFCITRRAQSEETVNRLGGKLS